MKENGNKSDVVETVVNCVIELCECFDERERGFKELIYRALYAV